MVPPTHNPIMTTAAQKDANASAPFRVDTVQNVIIVSKKDMHKMEYHHDAISFLVDPSQKASANATVNLVRRVVVISI